MSSLGNLRAAGAQATFELFARVKQREIACVQKGERQVCMVRLALYGPIITHYHSYTF